jgi:hypothetical protein
MEADTATAGAHVTGRVLDFVEDFWRGVYSFLPKGHTPFLALIFHARGLNTLAY